MSAGMSTMLLIEKKYLKYNACFGENYDETCQAVSMAARVMKFVNYLTNVK